MPGPRIREQPAAPQQFLTYCHARLLLEDNQRRKATVDAIHERPIAVRSGFEQRLQHFWKRKSRIETIRSGLQIEGSIQRTQSRENGQLCIAQTLSQLPNFWCG